MKKNIWLDGIMGVIIGDALGVPVQFLDREEIRKNPVTEMIGYGAFLMPPGAWSDDGSMTLATLDSIRQKRVSTTMTSWNVLLPGILTTSIHQQEKLMTKA